MVDEERVNPSFIKAQSQGRVGSKECACVCACVLGDALMFLLILFKSLNFYPSVGENLAVQFSWWTEEIVAKGLEDGRGKKQGIPSHASQGGTQVCVQHSGGGGLHLALAQLGEE